MPAYSPDLRISPHFTWREFWASDGTEPPAWLQPAYVVLARLYLEPVRMAFGVCTVHSGYRTPAINARVGGAPQSVHMGRRAPLAAAADVTFRSGTPREWYAAFDRLGVGGLGIYATHVHVDGRSGRARW